MATGPDGTNPSEDRAATAAPVVPVDSGPTRSLPKESATSVCGEAAISPGGKVAGSVSSETAGSVCVESVRPVCPEAAGPPADGSSVSASGVPGPGPSISSAPLPDSDTVETERVTVSSTAQAASRESWSTARPATDAPSPADTGDRELGSDSRSMVPADSSEVAAALSASAPVASILCSDCPASEVTSNFDVSPVALSAGVGSDGAFFSGVGVSEAVGSAATSTAAGCAAGTAAATRLDFLLKKHTRVTLRSGACSCVSKRRPRGDQMLLGRIAHAPVLAQSLRSLHSGNPGC